MTHLHGAFWRGALAVGLLLVCVLTRANGAEAVPRAVQAITRTVVRIHVVEANYVDGREVKSELFGSGAIIAPEGYVITNHHVAGKGKYFTCTLTDREELQADLVGTDPITDIAVLKLRATDRRFPAATFGNSVKVKVGDRVFAIGSPLALDQSITNGIVSNTALSLPEFLPEELMLLDGENIGAVVQWIGHDAPIYGGNSGGPLVNTRGEIIGINEIEIGLSGAIPGNLARDMAQQLITRKTVTRAWLGFSVQPTLKSAAETRGVLITGTLDGSPARAAGFQPGDLLIRLHGTAVDVRFREGLPAFNLQVMRLPIGTPVQAVVLRDGKEETLTVTPAPRPPSLPREQELPAWGLCARDISVLNLGSLQRSSTAGVLVTSLRPGGPAGNAKPGLEADDVIVRVAGEPVNTLQELTAVTQRLLHDSTEPMPVLVEFERGASRLRTVVPLNAREIDEPDREVRKAWLPIDTQVLTRELAAALHLSGKSGVCVTQVYPKSTAARAALQVGDIITALDDQPIPATRPEDTDVLPAMVRAYKVGSTVTLTVLREGKVQAMPVELALAPLTPRAMPRYRDEQYEFIARDLAFADRSAHHWDDEQTGVLIDSVSDGGWAALGHLEVGDLLQAVNNTPVTNVAKLQAVMQQVATERPATLVVRITRGTANLFLEWKAVWEP